MNAKLSKKSEKSLIFLIWKQRNVINALVRHIKVLLAERRDFENLLLELQLAKNDAVGRNKGYEIVYQKWIVDINEATEKCREQAKEIAYLKGRLEGKTESEVANG